MAVAHAVGNKLAHEVQHAGAVGQGELIAVHAVDRNIVIFGRRLQTVQVIGAVPFLQLIPITQHFFEFPAL